MRCCTTLVQIRQKIDTSNDNGKAVPYIPNQRFDSALHNPTHNTIKSYLPPETPHMLMDESLILQQISKKYILIPKLRCTHSNDYSQGIKSHMEESNDWKSKYDILEQLKKNEKENSEPISDTTFSLQKENTKENDDYISTVTSNVNAEPNVDFYENVNNFKHDNNYCNEKTNSNGDEISNYNLNNNIEINETGPESYQLDVRQNEKTQEENNNGFHNKLVSEEKKDTEMKADAGEESMLISHETIYDEKEVSQNDHTKEVLYNTEEYYENKECDNSTINNKQESILNLTGGNLTQTEVSEPNIGEQPEFPIEIIDPRDFTPYNDMQDGEELKMDPKDQLVKSSEDNSNDNNASVTLGEDNNEKSENIFDPIIVTENTDLSETAGVETFAEYNDGYYDEQTAENYVYNEEGTAENYNTEYSAPNENYNQEEYTAYYEGAQTDPPYAIEKTEDEAALQQYDQNYQQQYSTGYDNLQEYQQQGYEQQYTDQGYQQNEYTEGDHIAQEDPSQYDPNQNDTQNYVEQVLDNEQGYILEKQNDIIETSNAEKTVITNSAETTVNQQKDQQVKAQ